MKVTVRIIFQAKQQGATLKNELNCNTYINWLKFQDAPRQIRFISRENQHSPARLK